MPGPAARIGEADAADFDVITGGNPNLHVQRDAMIAAAELGFMGIETHLMMVGQPGGLVACRPEHAAVSILNVDPRSPGVEGAVGAPAGEIGIAPTAEATTRASDQDA